MTVASYTTSTARQYSGPHEVDSLIGYAMNEMQRLGLLYIGPNGVSVFVGTSRNKLIQYVTDTVHLHVDRDRQRGLVDAHLANLILAEQASYRRAQSERNKFTSPHRGAA